MAEPAASCKTRPRSATLDAAHEVIRALGLRGGEGEPPQEDAGTDSDLEEIPEPSTGSTPAEPAPRRNGATAPAKAGAPKSTPSPAPITKGCPRLDARPHAPPYATMWRRAGSWMRPHAAA